MHQFWGPQEDSLCSICAVHPKCAGGGLGRSDGAPAPPSPAAMPVGFCHVSGCPVGARTWGGTGHDPALCNFAAFYLKPALSQEKRELLGMTVASGNPGEDRVGGKNHRRGPELGRTWRGTAAPSATGHLRPPPS